MFWAFFLVDVFFDNRALGELAATFSVCQQVPYVAFTLMVVRSWVRSLSGFVAAEALRRAKSVAALQPFKLDGT